MIRPAQAAASAGSIAVRRSAEQAHVTRLSWAIRMPARSFQQSTGASWRRVAAVDKFGAVCPKARRPGTCTLKSRAPSAGSTPASGSHRLGPVPDRHRYCLPVVGGDLGSAALDGPTALDRISEAVRPRQTMLGPGGGV